MEKKKIKATTIPYTMKQCSKCKGIKPKVDFSKFKHGKDGLKSWCKCCCKKANLIWQRENKEKCREANKRSHKKNYCPDKNRELKLLSRYNISLEQYKVQEKYQDYKCIICGASEGRAGKRLQVDHCHTTGEIRGLLCDNCNGGLGQFKDSTKRLNNAIKYLESNGDWNVS